MVTGERKSEKGENAEIWRDGEYGRPSVFQRKSDSRTLKKIAQEQKETIRRAQKETNSDIHKRSSPMQAAFVVLPL